MTARLVSLLLYNNDLDTLYDMVSKGANIDYWLEQNVITWIMTYIGKFNQGMLHFVLRHCHYDDNIIENIINLCVDRNDFTNLEILLCYIPNISKFQVLDNACIHGNNRIIFALLHHGANISYRTGNGKHIIHTLITNCQQKLLHTLLKNNKINHLIEIADYHAVTPLMLAIKCGNVNIVRILLNFGANAQACDDQGWNMLHLYVMWLNKHPASDLEIIEMLYLLIGYGANIEYKNHGLNAYDLATANQVLLKSVLTE